MHLMIMIFHLNVTWKLTRPCQERLKNKTEDIRILLKRINIVSYSYSLPDRVVKEDVKPWSNTFIKVYRILVIFIIAFCATYYNFSALRRRPVFKGRGITQVLFTREETIGHLQVNLQHSHKTQFQFQWDLELLKRDV